MDYQLQSDYIKAFTKLRGSIPHDQFLQYMQATPLKGEELYYLRGHLKQCFGGEDHLYAGYPNSLDYWSAVAEAGSIVSEKHKQG